MPELVTVEQIAMRAGLPVPVSPEHGELIGEAISDAYAEVAAYIEQSPVPLTYTQRGVSLDARGQLQLVHEPVVSVTSVTAETDPLSGQPNGLYTVVYVAGLDPEADQEYAMVLGRYVKWSAAQNPLVRRAAQKIPGARLTASASVEGQSVTYEKSGGDGAAGAPPTLADLDGYRRLTVYQRPGIAPHPIDEAFRWAL